MRDTGRACRLVAGDQGLFWWLTAKSGMQVSSAVELGILIIQRTGSKLTNTVNIFSRIWGL